MSDELHPAYVRATDAIDRYLAAQGREQHRAAPDPLHPYAPPGERGWGQFSFFRDLLALADARAHLKQPAGQTRYPAGTAPPARAMEDVEQAALRIERSRLNEATEYRDLSGQLGAGGEFLPRGSGLPSYLAEAFVVAARARGRLLAALPSQPMPDGLKIETPKLSSGASVGSPADLAAVSETDPATALVTGEIGTIVGQVDVDRKLLERSRPGFDLVLARELGKALGQEVDRQLVAGSGATNQLRGLVNWSGLLAVTYTDAAPDVQAATSKVWQGFADCSGASGWGNPDEAAYVTIMHPRRYAFFSAGSGAANPPVRPPLPGRVVTSSAAIRTNLGAGTEDEIFVLCADGEAVFTCSEPPRIRLIVGFGSASESFVVRVQVQQYVALSVMAPTAIARVSGTGLIAPTF